MHDIRAFECVFRAEFRVRVSTGSDPARICFQRADILPQERTAQHSRGGGEKESARPHGTLPSTFPFLSKSDRPGPFFVRARTAREFPFSS